MISHTTDKFRKAFRNLPVPIQRKARKAFHLWRQNPGNPLLHYKQVHQIKPVYSIRIGLGWRAVGIKARKSDDLVLGRVPWPLRQAHKTTLRLSQVHPKVVSDV